MSELEKFSVHHDYYCNETNFYSDEAGNTWETMTEFLDIFENADVNMNLCFRWDIKNRSDDEEGARAGRYCAEVFLIGQRKGIFMPHTINHINEAEMPRFKRYLEKHWLTMLQIWTPISGDNANITRKQGAA